MNFRQIAISAAIFSLAVWAFGLMAAEPSKIPAKAPVYGYRVIHTYPHDPTSFTEGLEYHNGFLYESTGLEGRSVLRKVELQTGKIAQQIHLPPELFGEGFTLFGQHIVQLTYKTELGFVYSAATFQQLNTFHYSGEGWSLTNDGTHIYMSDGTTQLRVWNPQTLREERRFEVRNNGKPVPYVNELEYVHGEIYANVWQTSSMLRISPADGHVLGIVDLRGLLSASEQEGVDVLNGIAYDAKGDRLFVTGKLWPKVFEIKLVKK